MGRPTAFVCAMPMELSPLVRKLGLDRARIAAQEVRAGFVGNRPVLGIVTGMGTHLAAERTEELVRSVDVDQVVVVGITGAIDDATPIGTIVHPETVVDAATGARYVPDRLGSITPKGTMWTTDELVTDPRRLADLRASGVASLDMETAAIAAVCSRRSIPWFVFRAVSDRATDGTVDDDVFHLSRLDGTPDLRAVARYVVRHPGRIPTLVRMGRNVRIATNRAADAAIAALTN